MQTVCMLTLISTSVRYNQHSYNLSADSNSSIYFCTLRRIASCCIFYSVNYHSLWFQASFTSPGRLLIGPDLYSNCLHVELLFHCEPLCHMSVLLLSNPRYPHFMNHADIQWPDGADDGRLVTEFHDLWWLSNLI